MEVCAIVLNWNGWEDTLHCIASLRSSQGVSLRIIVVDNGSSDDSIEHIEPELESGVEDLIRLECNHGFTGGVNAGLARFLATDDQFALLVNNDATLDPACIARLVSALKASPTTGIAGPKILSTGDHSRLWSAGVTVSWPLARVREHRGERDGAEHKDARVVDGVSGCVCLIRRETIQQVGTLDDRYFAYYEDLDYCFRARSRGIRTLYVSRATAYHDGSASSNRGGTGSQSVLINYYGARNGLLCLMTHAPRRVRPMTLLVFAGTLVLALAKIELGGLVLRKPGAGNRARAIVRGIRDASLGRYGRDSQAVQ